MQYAKNNNALLFCYSLPWLSSLLNPMKFRKELKVFLESKVLKFEYFVYPLVLDP